MINSIHSIIEYIGYASTVIVVVISIYGVLGWIKGILPAILRLGHGLANRKVAIFARGDHLSSLESLLLDSDLFGKKNLIEIASPGDIGRSERASIFLVYWPDWDDHLASILAAKADDTALLIYSPQKAGHIPAEKIAMINEVRNSSITNFRGRLMSDIVLAMITTSYD